MSEPKTVSGPEHGNGPCILLSPLPSPRPICTHTRGLVQCYRCYCTMSATDHSSGSSRAVQLVQRPVPHTSLPKLYYFLPLLYHFDDTVLVPSTTVPSAEFPPNISVASTTYHCATTTCTIFKIQTPQLQYSSRSGGTVNATIIALYFIEFKLHFTFTPYH